MELTAQDITKDIFTAFDKQQRDVTRCTELAGAFMKIAGLADDHSSQVAERQAIDAENAEAEAAGRAAGLPWKSK